VFTPWLITAVAPKTLSCVLPPSYSSSSDSRTAYLPRTSHDHLGRGVYPFFWPISTLSFPSSGFLVLYLFCFVLLSCLALYPVALRTGCRRLEATRKSWRTRGLGW
jgi:hypothetical protein